MGFVWVQAISAGASIDAADLIEIRTNVDTVDDEKCAADKVGHDSDYKDGDDTSYDPGYYNDQHGTYRSSALAHCPNYYPGHMSVYYTPVAP
ncbi:hypothetical protein ES708_31172 [subsurface metagenome]